MRTRTTLEKAGGREIALSSLLAVAGAAVLGDAPRGDQMLGDAISSPRRRLRGISTSRPRRRRDSSTEPFRTRRGADGQCRAVGDRPGDADAPVAADARAVRLLAAAAGLVGSPRGLARGVALLICRRLFAVCPPADGIGKALANALERDPDVARHVSRQKRFFYELRSPRRARVEGLVVAADDDAPESLVAALKADVARPSGILVLALLRPSRG